MHALDVLSPPNPPAHLLEGVGSGDFWENGFALTELIRKFAWLQPDDRILDAGCGLGRVAWPLSRELDESGTYDGLDAVLVYLEWCNHGLGLDPARFRFHYLDVYSSFYNPNGSVRPEAVRFPFDDGAFSLVIATSLFTHLSAPAAANYLRETARVLAPGGRLFASFFILDDESRRVIETGPTAPPFTMAFAEGMLSDPDDPDFAIALDVDWLYGQFRAAGYDIAAYAQGVWRRRGGPTHQDLVVARKV